MMSPKTMLTGRPCHWRCAPQAANGPSHVSLRRCSPPAAKGYAPLITHGALGARCGVAHNPQRSSGSRPPWCRWPLAALGLLAPG